MEMKDSPLLVDLSDSEITSVCDSLVFLGHAGFANSHKTSEIKASNKCEFLSGCLSCYLQTFVNYF